MEDWTVSVEVVRADGREKKTLWMKQWVLSEVNRYTVGADEVNYHEVDLFVHRLFIYLIMSLYVEQALP